VAIAEFYLDLYNPGEINAVRLASPNKLGKRGERACSAPDEKSVVVQFESSWQSQWQ
jgi:hypothetical protein